MADGHIGGAGAWVKPDGGMPRRQKTAAAVKPSAPLSSGDGTEIADRGKLETQRSRVRDGGGGTDSTMQPEEGLSAAAASPHAETIAAIVQLQRQRTFCIRTQSRTDRSTEQFIARECLGYSAALPPDQRKAVMAEAMRIRVAGERPLKQTAKGDRSRGEARFVTLPTNGRDRENPAGLKMVVPSVDPPDTDEQDAGGGRSVAEAQPLLVPTDDRRDHNRPETRQSAVPPVAAPIIQMSYLARTAADSLRKTTEREMARLAATLPVEPWRAEVNGFGRLGLAIIVAEAGRDLACYPTVAKLWKRLGLAVIDGERQRRKTDPELAALHGYVPRRRAEMWTLADSMFRHQWHGGQDGNDGAPAGPYGDVYARRRVTTALTHPEWTRAHQRDDAKRVMFKALLADLWGAWCGRRASPATTHGG